MCLHASWVHAANPYRSEQIIVLVALLFGLLAWRRVKPRPTWVVASYMAAASVFTVFVTGLQVCTDIVATPVVSGELTVLQASTALTVCIYVEVVRALRQRRHPESALALALALHTRRNSSE